jgi:hypothetical protein
MVVRRQHRPHDRGLGIGSDVALGGLGDTASA